jgi:L-amino acid N-acyltransferase YncA
MDAEVANYHKVVTLPNGLRVEIHVLSPANREGLVDLFACAAEDDLQYFRHDVTNRALVASWAERVDLQRVVPLVAEVNGRVVGQGTLHRGRGGYRHVAEVRIFVCREFRARGVGTALIRALTEVARQIGLHHIFILAVSSRPRDIHAFEGLGFRVEGSMRDRFMDAEGNTYDMIEMALPIKRESMY